MDEVLAAVIQLWKFNEMQVEKVCSLLSILLPGKIVKKHDNTMG